MCKAENPLVPKIATIESIIEETEDIKTFRVILDNKNEKEAFNHKPGQCGMVSVFGVGEAMISITSTPTRKDFLEFSIKKVGSLTNVLHSMDVGETIGIRGPYGNYFPYDAIKGKDLIFIGGGIGLAPLRSLINYAIDNREEYGNIHIIYGARSYKDLAFKEELFNIWPSIKDTKVDVTVDSPCEEWNGNVGFVPAFLENISPNPQDSIAITCGPPIMIKYVLNTLQKIGFDEKQVITTLEMKMKCGIGKCGRCNIGHKYVCIDGPVFTLEELKLLPNEF